MKALKDLLHGFAFGVANIIPGVSGGTLALVLGFYERLLGFLNRLNATTLKELAVLKLRWLAKPLNRERTQAFFGRLAEDDWPFIGRLLAGALIAILALAKLMDLLLNDYFAWTYAFFFGLILVSIRVPWVLIQRKTAGVWVCLFLGVAVTVGIAASVDPYEKALRKSDLYKAQAAQNINPEAGAPAEEPKAFSFAGTYTGSEYLLIFIAGMIAISAMVLPGISGSLMMILLGQYFILIRAISSLLENGLLDDMLFLACCAVGMAIGLLLTARGVEWALKKAHDATMAFLTGLIVGSLYALWPFKVIHTLDEVQRDGSILQGRNIASNVNQIPSDVTAWLPVLGLMALGAGIMWGVMQIENRETAA